MKLGIFGSDGSASDGIGIAGNGNLTDRSTPMSGSCGNGSFGNAGSASDGTGIAGSGSRKLRSTPKSGSAKAGILGRAGRLIAGIGIAGIGIAILHMSLAGCARPEPRKKPRTEPKPAAPASAVAMPTPEKSRAAVRYAASQLGLLADAAARAPRDNAAACRGRLLAVNPVRNEIRDRLDDASPDTPGHAAMVEAIALSILCLGCDDSFREACPRVKHHISEAERAMSEAGF